MRADIAAVARLSLAALVLLTAVGCGGPDSAQSHRQDDAAETAADVSGRDPAQHDETVFDDMLETQDRAGAVEDLTLGRKGELDRALESAEGEPSPEDP